MTGALLLMLLMGPARADVAPPAGPPPGAVRSDLPPPPLPQSPTPPWALPAGVAGVGALMLLGFAATRKREE